MQLSPCFGAVNFGSCDRLGGSGELADTLSHFGASAGQAVLLRQARLVAITKVLVAAQQHQHTRKDP